MDSYLRAVQQSRPGDWFALWSVDDLAKQDALLIRKTAAPICEAELRAIDDWLNEDQMREFIAVGRSDSAGPPEVRWGDFDSMDQIRELAERCAASGEFAVLPLTNLVGRAQWQPRLHLANAKRPNDKGEVPLGGAY
jgi:hypothetical protein